MVSAPCQMESFSEFHFVFRIIRLTHTANIRLRFLIVYPKSSCNFHWTSSRRSSACSGMPRSGHRFPSRPPIQRHTEHPAAANAPIHTQTARATPVGKHQITLLSHFALSFQHTRRAARTTCLAHFGPRPYSTAAIDTTTRVPAAPNHPLSSRAIPHQ